MRRRLLVVLLATVVTALSVAGLATYTLLKRDDSTREIERLRETSQRLAENIDAVNSLDAVLSALNLTAAAEVRFPANAPRLDDVVYLQEKGLPVQNLIEVTSDWSAGDFAAVAKGTTVARINRGLTWAMAPIGPAEDQPVVASADGTRAPEAFPLPGQFEAIVLVGPVKDTARRAVGLLALASLAALLVTIAAATVIAQNLSAPLRAATAAYRRIASGDLDVRVRDAAIQSPDRRSRRPALFTRSNARTDEVEELLGALDSMAESLQRARDQERQFLLSVSHDLRTPLTSIRGYAEALADGAVTDPVRSAAVIVNESRRLERLVRDLLDLAKLESKQFTLQKRRVDLSDLVTDAADGFLPSATESGLGIELDADENVFARTDPDRLGQVIANLIENALKYARTTVCVSLHAAADARVIAVADDGPGIDPEDVPRIFERAFVSDRRPTRMIGSGLGLAIVAELVEALGATIGVETSPEGTTISVRWSEPAVVSPV